jgi:uncharacterized protein YndB with AHSA1/START domain
MHNAYSEGTRAIARSFTLKMSPQQLFDCVATAEGWEQWFCHKAEARPFGFTATWHMGGSDTTIDCAVLESTPPDAEGNARFALRWESEYPGHDTIATFEIAAHPHGSRLKFTETGFGDGPEWDRAYTEQDNGWFDCFMNLARHDERVANFRRRPQPEPAQAG